MQIVYFFILLHMSSISAAVIVRWLVICKEPTTDVTKACLFWKECFKLIMQMKCVLVNANGLVLNLKYKKIWWHYKYEQMNILTFKGEFMFY